MKLLSSNTNNVFPTIIYFVAFFCYQKLNIDSDNNNHYYCYAQEQEDVELYNPVENNNPFFLPRNGTDNVNDTFVPPYSQGRNGTDIANGTIVSQYAQDRNGTDNINGTIVSQYAQDRNGTDNINGTFVSPYEQSRSGELHPRVIDPTPDFVEQQPITWNIPRLMTHPCILFGEDVDYESRKRQFFWRCEIEDGILLPIVGYESLNSNDYYEPDDNGLPIVSGETTMFSPEIQIDSNGLVIPYGVKPIVQRMNPTPAAAASRYNRITEGDKPILIVRVNGEDVSTTRGSRAIRDKFFGTRGDNVTLKSQFALCSNNKTNIIPLNYTPNYAGLRVNDGFVTVNLPNVTILRSTRHAIANAVSGVLKSFGFRLSSSGNEDYHHIIYCLPPGTVPERSVGPWAAYSYMNHFISVFNDKNCNYVSLQMHEIGHNLLLSNSNRLFTSASRSSDKSGVMGGNVHRDNGPIMCYNGPQSWQLGWYSDRQLTINPIYDSWRGDLIGLVDYNKVNANVILRVKTNSSSAEYYIVFNHENKYNRGTMTGGNQVLITKKCITSRTANADTVLLAEMTAGCSFSFYDNMVNGSFGPIITVKVNIISLATVPARANVEVYSSPSTEDNKQDFVGLVCENDSDSVNRKRQFKSECADHQCEVKFSYPGGSRNTKPCAEVRKNICELPAVDYGNKPVYQICQASCSMFPKLLDRHPDYTCFVNKYISNNSTGTAINK